MLQRQRMRNRKPLKYQPANLFCHRSDDAFELLERLEDIFSRMIPRPGSRYLRDRLHRASARLAQMIIEASDDARSGEVSTKYEPAILMCKIIDGILRLLGRYAVLALTDHREAVRIAVRLAKIIARRYFGFDVGGTDDGSESGSAPSGAPAGVVGDAPMNIAADAPPLAAADG